MVLLGNFREHPLRIAASDFVFDRIGLYRPSLILCACTYTVICSLLLGGVAQPGELSDAILELLAIPALLFALSSLINLPNWKTGLRRDAFWGLALCCAIAALPLIQLIPLPAGLWTVLPGRQEMVKVYDILGRQPPWMPISVSPSSTWLSFLSLLPPIAIFVAAIQLTYRERRTVVLLIVAFAVISVFLGLVQLAQGPQSSLRFYKYANPDDAVGFFGNRDHFAALLYAALVFASVWAIDISFKLGSWADLRKSQQFTIVTATTVFMAIVVLLVGEVVARSRAGLGLTMVAFLAVFALAFTDERRRSGESSGKIFFAAISVAVILCVQFALYRILERFTGDPLGDARLIFAKNTIRAAWTFMPFGSGLGSFVPVYEMFEKPVDALAGVYVNHAHNDYLELWLETGVMGIIVIGLFVYWCGRNSVKHWRDHSPNTSALDRMLVRAATVVIALLLVHALVDFSLQTEAIMAVFAVSCALLVAPSRIAEEVMRAAQTFNGDAVQRKPAATRLVPTSVFEKSAVRVRGTEVPLPNSSRAGERWGGGIEWPGEWQSLQERKTSAPSATRIEPNDVAEPSPSESFQSSQSNPPDSDTRS